jgi:O-antigen/teichoic acid export membrane protein
VPLTATPIIVNTVSPERADWFSLVIADSSILAVFLGLSQHTAVQGLPDSRRAGDVAVTAFLVSLAIALLSLLLRPIGIISDDRWMASVSLAFCVSIMPLGQALARRLQLLGQVAVVEWLRLGTFLVAVIWLLAADALTAPLMIGLLGAYYALPAIWWIGRDWRAWDVRPGWRDWKRLLPSTAIFTISAGLNVAAWMLLRYRLEEWGQTGDVGAFSALQSVAACMSVLADLVMFRLGHTIVRAARGSDSWRMRAVGSRYLRLCLVAGLVSAAVSVAYAIVQFPQARGVALLTILLLVLTNIVRCLYMFAQQVLLGLQRSGIDLLASAILFGCSALAAGPLVQSAGIVGAAIGSVVLSAANLTVVIGAIMFHNRLGTRR